MKKTVYLCVERDDSEYDYKAGFASYTEANGYRQECQRSSREQIGEYAARMGVK